MPECTKAYYLNQAAARVALAAILEKAERSPVTRKQPVRVYPCDVCDGWHLTGKPTRGKKPAWDRDPDWVRPGPTNHLRPRSREVTVSQTRAALRYGSSKVTTATNTKG